MNDQPELFISADSKYKGMKPVTMTMLAENLRAAITLGVQDRYGVVESLGDSTLYMRMAAGKPAQELSGYIPASRRINP